MYEVKYPLLFAGCGDGICMPFRGERCYIRQCPECSPENLQYNYYGRTDFWNYPDCLNDNSCYDISKCFCPPEGDFDFNLDKCPNSVRDSYGCVLIKDINEEAEAPCQCGWNKELTLTTVRYGEGIFREEKHYCCPENAQIAFSHGATLLNYPNNNRDYIRIGGANCGNMSMSLSGICIPSNIVVIQEDGTKRYGYLLDFSDNPYEDTIHLRDVITTLGDLMSVIKDRLRKKYEANPPNYPARLKYFVNYTYYNGSVWSKVENEVHWADIWVKDCTWSDFDLIGKCDCDNSKENCVCYHGNKKSAEWHCGWFSDWSLYSCRISIYMIAVYDIKCSEFYAGEKLFSGNEVNWEGAPIRGKSTTDSDNDDDIKDKISFCNYRVEDIKQIFEDLTTLGGRSSNGTIILRHAPIHGYVG